MARAGMWQRTKTWLIEALGGAALGAISSSSDVDAGWRPITERAAGKSYRRDLSPLSQDQMLRVSHYLYTGNALAQFLINVPVALTVGRSVGYTLEFDHEALGMSREAAEKLSQVARGFIDPWWEHPAHDFKGRGPRYASTYLVTGELLLVIPEEGGTNETTGLPMLDYIDSALIHDVEGRNGLSTTPGRVLVKAPGGSTVPFDVILPGIARRQDSESAECFFFRHTGRLNSLRGTSDLLAQADWIDLHDQLLFGRVDKAILSNTLVHDLTVEGAQNKEALDAEVKRFAEASVKPGGIFAHNEKVKHEIKTADLKEVDNATLVRQVLLFVLGSKGYPEHWFAEGGNANRATSTEQNEVAYKMLEGLQEELLGIFRTPLQVAYDRLAEKQHNFPSRDKGGVTIIPNLPKISERDVSRVGQIIASVEAGLDSAVMSGRLSMRTAQRVTLALVEKFTGEQIDPDDELVRIEAEKAEREQLEQERADAAARAALKLKRELGDDDDKPAGGRRVGRAVREAVLAGGGDEEEDAVRITLSPHIEIHKPTPAPTVDPEVAAMRLATEANTEAVRELGVGMVDAVREVVAGVPDAVREAVAAQPAPAAPQVNVTVQPAPPTPITVQPSAASVNVMPAEVKAPDVKVDVHVPEDGPTETLVEHDEKGQVERMVKRPLKERKR